MQSLLDEDDAQSQEQLAEELNVDQATISRRLQALGKIRKEGKWVPHELKERDIHVPNIESTDSVSTIELIWIKRRQGLDYQADVDKLIYEMLGKTV